MFSESQASGSPFGLPMSAQMNQINDADLMFSDEEYREMFAEMLCSHYIAQGMDEAEAVENVMSSLRDPKWKIDISHQAKTRNELVPALQTFFEATAPERLGEVEELCDTYSNKEVELSQTLHQEYPDSDFTELDETIKHIEIRFAVVERKKAEGTQLESFLRKFFARFDPWDGAGKEEKSTELYQQYFFRASWTSLYEVLRNHYPQALELTELVNYLKEGEAFQLGDEMYGATTSTPDLNGTTGAFTSSATREATERDAPQETPGPIAEASPRADRDVSPPNTGFSEGAGGEVFPKMERRFWLESNARIARYYYRYRRGSVLAKFFRDVCVSVGFRIYFTVILLWGVAVVCLLFVHLAYLILWRLFVNDGDSYAGTMGLLCLLVALLFTATAAVTSMVKVVKQWVFLDDAVFFGDVDYAKMWEKRNLNAEADAPALLLDTNTHLTFNPINPVPVHLQTVLPPQMNITIFGLQTTKRLIREWYISGLVLFTTLFPLGYSLIRCAVEGESAVRAASYFAEFVVFYAISLHLLLGIYYWSLSVREKYKLYYLWALKKEKFATLFGETILLKEFALDSRTVTLNCLLLMMCLAPIGLLFWTSSHVTVDVSVEWIVSILVIAAILLTLRELLRMQRFAKAMTTTVLALQCIFLIAGIVGTISIHYSALILFVILILYNQLFMVSHRERAVPLISLASLKSQLETRLHGRKPQKGEVPSLPDNEENDLAELTTAEGDHLIRQDTIEGILHKAAQKAKTSNPTEGDAAEFHLPGRRFFYALCSCRFWCSPVEYTDLPRVSYYPHFLSDLHFRIKNPKHKLKMTVSLPIMFTFGLCLLIFSGAVLGIAKQYKQSGGGFDHDTTYTTAELRAYPLCKLSFYTLSPTDLAFLAEMSYVNSLTDVTGYLSRLDAAGLSWYVGNAGEEHWGADVVDINYLVVNVTQADNSTAHVVVVKSNLVGQHLGRDVDIWGDSVLFSTVKAVVPVLGTFSDGLAESWVNMFASVKYSLDGDEGPEQRYFEDFVTTLRLAFGTNPILLVGHGTNGGVASIAGSLLSAPVVAFSPPGTQRLQKKFDLKANNRLLNIIPRYDQMADVDSQVWPSLSLPSQKKKIQKKST